MSRALVIPLALVMAVPPAMSSPSSAPGMDIAPSDMALDTTETFTPQPKSEDISEELRAMVDEGELVAANTTRRKKSSSRKTGRKTKASAAAASEGALSAPPPTTTTRRTRSGGNVDSRLKRAMQFVEQKNYAEASKILFPLSRNPQFQAESTRIRYALGRTLYEMKMYQTAAFVFLDVVRQESRDGGRGSRYLRQALEQLSLAADALDSDVLLKYAIKKVNETDFPSVHRDMLYFRTGEIRMSEKNYAEAARIFGRVRPTSPFFSKAKYKQALAFAEAKELEKAQAAFEDLSAANSFNEVTDINRVSGLLGKARTLYQRQNWDGAIDAYREIPRDTEQWHEALFESTWANLRSRRFRSALSNFHSLHSDYYEDFYQPESLILRAIVYAFICRYDEMEKVLGLFDRVYKPVRRDVATILKSERDATSFYREIARVNTDFSSIRSSRRNRGGMQIPFLVARYVLKEGDVRRGLNYVARLEAEKKMIASAPGSWTRSAVGQYAQKIVDRRLQSTQQYVGKLVKRHLYTIGRELLDLSEQKDLLVVETLSGRREAVGKQLQGKSLDKKSKIDDDTARDYFVQNGYEYWPFTGEYWLDEIGNYQYVGVQACE